MLPTPTRSGNLHPAAVNRSSPTTGMGAPAGGGGFRGGGGGALSLDVDEAEARTRAREILQDFVKHKNRAEEVESQLQKALMENERLSHLLHETKTELSVERERGAREMDQVRMQSKSNETRVEAAQEEVRKVAQSFAQRASDQTSQLRLKDQEVQHLEGELQRSKEEIRSLRKESIRAGGIGGSQEDIERSHHRVVELARRCLDLEKDKDKLSQSILEDRRHYQQALRTIEALRKQCVESDDRTQNTESLWKGQQDKHDATIALLHREMDMQRELYKGFMTQLGGAVGGSPVAARLTGADQAILASSAQTQAAATTLGLSGKPVSIETELALSRQREHNAQEQLGLLNSQLEAGMREKEDLARSLAADRSGHIEEVARMQSDIHTLQHELDVCKIQSESHKDEVGRGRQTYEQLKAVHEALKSDFTRQSQEVTRAITQLETVNTTHNALHAKVDDLQDQLRVRESVCDKLNSALANRRNLQEEIRQLKVHHQHEIEIQRVQHLSALKVSAGQAGHAGHGGQDAVNATHTAYHSANQMFEISRETSDSIQTRLSNVEHERAQWHKEKEHLMQQAKLEKDGAQQELNSLQRALEGARVEAAELRSEATHALKEVGEWKTAFSSSEKARTALQQQLDELRDEVYNAQKSRSSAEVRQNMFSQHVQRLEMQIDRDRQDLFRLRRALGASEVQVARKDVEFTSFKLRQQRLTMDAVDNTTTLEQERELVQLKVEKEKVEITLKDREVGLQQLHEEHLAAVGRKAAPPMVVDVPASETNQAFMAAQHQPPVQLPAAAVVAPEATILQTSSTPLGSTDPSLSSPPRRSSTEPPIEGAQNPSTAPVLVVADESTSLPTADTAPVTNNSMTASVGFEDTEFETVGGGGATPPDPLSGTGGGHTQSW